MAAKPFRLSPLAEADLENIWLYTVQQWSRQQADSYLRDLTTAFRELAAGNRQGRATNIRPGYEKYPCGSHIIYYTNHPGHLDVIRVLHKRQDAERNL
ncbi:MAG: type II toxin-antitoxin system RelE/ParE family toxin [Pseudoxanthomonas sp.]